MLVPFLKPNIFAPEKKIMFWKLEDQFPFGMPDALFSDANC